eukprot:scaffold121322_cov21-Tisochrysis_lutea.AAC.1
MPLYPLHTQVEFSVTSSRPIALWTAYNEGLPAAQTRPHATPPVAHSDVSAALSLLNVDAATEPLVAFSSEVRDETRSNGSKSLHSSELALKRHSPERAAMSLRDSLKLSSNSSWYLWMNTHTHIAQHSTAQIIHVFFHYNQSRTHLRQSPLLTFSPLRAGKERNQSAVDRCRK